jgi:hypothetical protein
MRPRAYAYPDGPIERCGGHAPVARVDLGAPHGQVQHGRLVRQCAHRYRHRLPAPQVPHLDRAVPDGATRIA